MSDRDRFEFRGPVRTVDIEVDGRSSRHEFRPDGALVRQWHQNGNGSDSTVIYTYDAADHLESVRFESSSGPTSLRRYEYDEAGRLARLLLRDPDGGERVLESCDYDAQGRKTKIFFAHESVGYGVEGSKEFYSAPNATTIITVYNGADRPAELLFRDAAGALLSRVDFRYDEFGHLIQESQTISESPLPPNVLEQLNPAQREAVRELLGNEAVQSIHRYYSFGRRIETVFSPFGQLSTRRVSMGYNEYGDLSQEITEREQRDFGFKEEGGPLESGPIQRSRSELRFRYEYDARGNWTSKIIESSHGESQDCLVASTERRTLTYFDLI